jgi:hypothetical protein
MKLKLRTLLPVAVALVSALTLFAQSTPEQAVRKTEAARMFGKLPLSFEPSPDATAYVAHSGASLVTVSATGGAVAVRDRLTERSQSVRFRFDQSVASAALAAMDEQQGVTNYYLGNDPAQWRLGVKNFGRVQARGVYPGVDVVYYGDHRRMEFDFNVAPGANPNNIALRFDGMERLTTESNGDLVAEVLGQPVRFARPYAYQRVTGGTKAVEASYVLTAGNVVRLKLGEYDKTSELVIDPVVTYATYIGGSGIDVANGIAVDSTGAAYITGQTASSNFPKPNNPSGYSFTGGSDAYVVKLSADGQTFSYTTIIGGTNPTLGFAQGNGIALDGSNKAYIVGGTSFKDLPGIINNYQGGDSDAFITILSAAGTMVRTAYLGGSDAEIGYGIAVDTTKVGGVPVNTVTAVGQTCSQDFPAYNAIETKVEACVAFVTKVDNGLHVGGPADPTSSAQSPAPASCGGAACYFSTFYGGQSVPPYATVAYASVATYIYAAVVEDTNNPPDVQFNLTGGYCTTGAGVPTWNTTIYGITIDGTCYWENVGKPGVPSTAYTEAYGVALDPVGDIFVAGGTNTTALSSPLYLYNARGGTGAWVIKLSSAQGNFIYGTALETTATDETLTIDTARAIAVDSGGQAYVAGTASGTIYISNNAYQKSVVGGTDAFLLRLNNQGSAIEYATYLGGSKNDQALGVAVDLNQTAYVTGTTLSPDFPTINSLENPNSSVQLSLSGGQDAFITKFTSDGTALIFSSYLGGSGSDQANAIAVDPTNLGNMYVAGNSTSLDLETTLNLQTTGTTTATYTPPQTSNAGNGDGFAAMVPSSGLPAVTVTPGSLYFVDQDLNTQSAAQAVQYTNTSTTASVTIQSIEFSPSANFGQAFVSGGSVANCTPDVIAASTACDIWVVFTPTVVGTTSGTLTITDSASSAPHVINLLGQGAAPYDVLSTSSLIFATQGVSTTSAAQTITLQNTGKGTLYITSLVAEGFTSASDFAQTNTCGTQVAPGGTCTISVTFTPNGAGVRNGNVTITDNAQGSPHVVSLTGTGRLVANTFSAVSLTFPQQQTGAASAPQTITITNTDATQNLVVNTPVVSTGFLISLDTCTSAAILPGGTCAIQVEFDPTTSGSFTGTLAITGNGSLMPATITLSGTAGATATLTSNVTFGGTVVGVTSPAQYATLTNQSSFPFSITSATLSGAAAGDFAVQASGTTCGTSLAASSSCNYAIYFTPTQPGNRNATLTVTSAAAASPQTVGILGVGLAPSVTLSQGATQNVTSVAFGSTPLNEASTAIVLTLTNNGTAALNMSSITFTGGGATEFSQTNTCGTQVLPSNSCSINVVFTPSALNGQGASMVIADNATPATQTVAVYGTGVQPAAPSFNPTPAVGLAFPSEPVSSTTAAQTITVTNNDPAYPITLGTPVMAGDFAVQASGTTCGTTLAKSANCVIAVVFTPTATGSRTGTLTLTSNALTTAAVFPLTGTGTTPTVGLSPATITFGNQAENTTSTAQTVTLTNNGNGALSLTSVLLGGSNPADYAQTNTCGSTVAASGGVCTVSVTFTPTGLGLRSASLIFTDNATGSPQSVAISGTGIAGSGTMTLTPSTLAFGNVALTTTSVAQSVAITNSSTTQTLTVNGVVVTGSTDFSVQSTTCSAMPFTLAIGGSCTVNVIYTPTVTTAETGTLTVSGSSTNSPQSVTLTGTGINATGALSLSPSSIPFGTVTEGSSATPQAITITNTSTTQTLSVTSVATTGNPDFSISSTTCGATPFTLAIGGTCTVSVTFSPTSAATETGFLRVAASSANSPQSVTLTGTGSSTVSSGPYTFTPSATSVSVVEGGTAVYSFSVAPQSGYTQTISFTCSSPAGSTCTFSPASLAMDGTTTKTTTLTVATKSGSAALRPAERPSLHAAGGVFYALLPFTILGAVLFGRRAGWKAVAVVLAICLVMFMASCGSGSSSSSGSSSLSPGSYAVTVTATSSGPTVTTVTTTLQLVVTSK